MEIHTLTLEKFSKYLVSEHCLGDPRFINSDKIMLKIYEVLYNIHNQREEWFKHSEGTFDELVEFLDDDGSEIIKMLCVVRMDQLDSATQDNLFKMIDLAVKGDMETYFAKKWNVDIPQ